ncbi:MAG: collagen-like protein, partial [Clostridia bacterium]|nr:collagen-like protein [Clostridia bacterium]
DKGDQGEQGLQGEKGDKGDQGEQGLQGEKGDKGDQGEQGLQGEKGDQGDQGEQGIGVSKVEIINEELVITLSDGNSINLGNIKGTKGDKGDKGDQGDKGADGTNGVDGVGIANVTISTEGALTVELTNGTILNLGNIKGADGIGISKSEINSNGELVLTYTNGTTANLGVVVGADGVDGVGIKTVTLSTDGELSILMTDNSTYNLGNIKGEKGDKGDTGATGRGILRTEISDSKLIIYYTDNTFEEHDLSGLAGSGSEDSSQLAFVLLPDGTYGVRANDNVNINDLVSIEIPATYKGVAVTQIMAEGFKNAISLESVSLPAGLETINAYAFYGCTSLTEIIIPSSVITIKEYVFYGSSVTSVTLDTTMDWTVSNVFWTNGTNNGDATLTNKGTVTLSGHNFTADISTPENLATVFTQRKGAFNSYYYYDVYKGVWTRGKTEEEALATSLVFELLDDGTYGVKASENFELSRVNIPSTYNSVAVTKILDNGFKDQEGLFYISFPATITTIGEYAFANCSNLTEVTIPSNVKTIGAYAFYNAGLTSATLENTSNWSLANGSTFSFSYTYYGSDYYGSGTKTGTYTHNLANKTEAANALKGPVYISYKYNDPDGGWPTSNFSGTKTFTWYATTWTHE